MVFFNNSLNNMKALNYTRISDNGNAFGFLSSSQWNSPALANISSIRMSSRITSQPANSTGNSTGIPHMRLIYNSLFDDCSKEVVADAGCGHNLQCNRFSDGKASCGPVANSMVKLLHSYNDEETYSIVVSKWHQTCGSSSRYNNKCATTDGRSLTCESVTAIVDGQIGEKSICLADFETQHLQKRPVRDTFWYSGGRGYEAQNFGTNWKAV
jgi:hypothetical protein